MSLIFDFRAELQVLQLEKKKTTDIIYAMQNIQKYFRFLEKKGVMDISVNYTFATILDAV